MCDEGLSHDRNSFSPRPMPFGFNCGKPAVYVRFRAQTGYDYKHSGICTILDTDHFGCRRLYSSLQIFNCSANALGVVETILPSPESHRSFLPSLIRASSESV